MYAAQAHYAEAEHLHKRSLAIRETALGPGHPHVATSLNNLALLYRAIERYSEAEPLFKRSISILETALGPDHPGVATSLNNLALVYFAQARYAEVELPIKRSLAIFEKTLGPDHPNVGQSLNNLAYVYGTQGRYTEAEPLFKRSLAIREKALGPDHPNVGDIAQQPSLAVPSAGPIRRGGATVTSAPSPSARGAGPGAPERRQGRSTTWPSCIWQGRYAEAEPLYRRSLAILEKALGPEHPDVGTALNNLAGCTRPGPLQRGRDALQAQPCHHEKAWARAPDVATSLNNLASLYQAGPLRRGRDR